ncbi:MAG: lysophospholipid acyltransferase family protein [Spirochaetales bacterium]|nr:lysophospholipid acyltransferase family protein [Spirochaetales bacterium]
MRAFIVNTLIRLAILFTVKLDRQSRKEFKKVMKKGPALLICNHVSNIEGPVIYTRLQPRNTIALGKEELWDKWATRQMMQAWSCIPISRSGVDQKAIAACKGVLERNDFLCIAPEGTRSKDGKMKQAKPGVTLFVDPAIPVVPIAFWGLEKYSENIKKLRRTPMNVRVGEPFYLQKPEGRFTTEKRQAMVDEMMMKLAEMMPQEYRGYYG